MLCSPLPGSARAAYHLSRSLRSRRLSLLHYFETRTKYIIDLHQHHILRQPAVAASGSRAALIFGLSWPGLALGVASSARHSNCPDPCWLDFSPSSLERRALDRIGTRTWAIRPTASTSKTFTPHLSKPCSLDSPGPGQGQGTEPPIIGPVYHPNTPSNSDSRFHHSPSS